MADIQLTSSIHAIRMTSLRIRIVLDSCFLHDIVLYYHSIIDYTGSANSYCSTVTPFSCLNKVIGKNISVSNTSFPLDNEGQLIPISNEILKTRERRLWSRTIKEYLVPWKDFPSKEATWEDEIFL